MRGILRNVPSERRPSGPAGLSSDVPLSLAPRGLAPHTVCDRRTMPPPGDLTLFVVSLLIEGGLGLFLVLFCFVLYFRSRQVLRRLAESEDRFRILFEHGGVGLALLSAEGAIVQANPALEQMLGYEPGQSVRPAMPLPPDLHDRGDETRRMRRTGAGRRRRPVRAREALPPQERRRRLGRVVRAVVRDGAGNVRDHASVLMDVTERRRLEEQAAPVSETGDLGDPCWRHCSRLQQPADRRRRQPGSGAGGPAPAGEGGGGRMDDARVASFVLWTVRRGGRPAVRGHDGPAVDLQPRPHRRASGAAAEPTLARGGASAAAGTAALRPASRFGRRTTFGRSNGDWVQLHQVVHALAVNAGDAMPDGGVLEHGAGQPRRRAGGVRPPTWRRGRAGSSSCVVRDDGLWHDGGGVRRGCSSRSSRPSRRARAPAWGCPRCTASSRDIRAGSRWSTEPGRGSTFRLYLPARPGDGARPSRRTAAEGGGGECVLVVDDEDMVREPAPGWCWSGAASAC